MISSAGGFRDMVTPLAGARLRPLGHLSEGVPTSHNPWTASVFSGSREKASFGDLAVLCSDLQEHAGNMQVAAYKSRTVCSPSVPALNLRAVRKMEREDGKC